MHLTLDVDRLYSPTWHMRSRPVSHANLVPVCGKQVSQVSHSMGSIDAVYPDLCILRACSRFVFRTSRYFRNAHFRPQLSTQYNSEGVYQTTWYATGDKSAQLLTLGLLLVFEYRSRQERVQLMDTYVAATSRSQTHESEVQVILAIYVPLPSFRSSQSLIHDI